MDPVVRRASELALSTLSDQERQSSAVYLDVRELEAGAKVTIGRAEIDTPGRGLLAFIDPSPTANWGHPCRYLLIESATGKTHRFDAQFPPFLRGTPSTLRLVWKGPQVPAAVLPAVDGIE